MFKFFAVALVVVAFASFAPAQDRPVVECNLSTVTDEPAVAGVTPEGIDFIEFSCLNGTLRVYGR